MKWAEIVVHTTHEAVDAVTNALYDFDIKGVSLVDSVELTRSRQHRFGEIYDLQASEYPTWGVLVKAYTPLNELVNDLLCQLDQRIMSFKDLGIDIGDYSVTMNEMDEEDWSETWKKYYHPVSISDRFTIVPTWEEYEKKHEDEIIIELDPGMAFGTGTHPTTRLSLQLLEKYTKEGDLVVDVGTGSGVLAIGAAQLGASKVLALDLDDVAVAAATENAKLNDTASKIEVFEGDLLHSVKETPDIIVSNILAEIIMSFSQDAYDALRPNGLFLTSGIIGKYEEDVVKDFEAKGFRILEIKREEDWIAIAAEKGEA